MTKPFSLDESTRAALEAHKQAHDLTHAELGKKLGFTATRITKFLGLNRDGALPEPDAPRIQSAAKAFLRHLARRAALKESLFEDAASAGVAQVLNLIRRTGDIGLIYGNAGVGKTCGAELFCRDNPNTIMCTASRYRRSAPAIAAMIFEEMGDTDACPRNLARALWMEHQLRGAERLVLIDNAQRLTLPAIEFLCDFNDATNCGIALIGNPEVIDLVRGSDQLHSRIGIKKAITSGKDHRDIARKLIAAIVPESKAELEDLATDALAFAGHVRHLKKQLTLTRELFHSQPAAAQLPWPDVWESAGQYLIKQLR